MIDCQKHLFDLPEEVSYLNCAYMGPLLKEGEAIGQQELKKRLRPYLRKIKDFFDPVDELKTNFAQLINCSEPDRIALLPSTSYGIANAAKNVQINAGQHILVVGEQFPSNIYSWQRIADEHGGTVQVCSPPDSVKHRSKTWNQQILQSINEHTAVIAMPIVHWADGTLFDLKTIRQKADEFGTLLIIDGTQSIGALPFDITEIQADAVICGAYKWLFCPYGFGIAYYGPKFDQGIPIEESWLNRKGSEQFANLVNYQPAYKPKAARYSVGEGSNFTYVAILNAAIKQILKWGTPNIQAYCEALVSPFLPKFEALGCVIDSEDIKSFHLFGIRMPEHIDVLKLKTQLEKEQVYISIRGNAIRVSPHLYNEEKDLALLLDCLKRVS